MVDVLDLKRTYNRIKTYVVESGFKNEIEWQENIDFEQIRESDFLRESAWVILCTGMNVNVIRKYFRDISLCFYNWESSKKIVEMKKYCIESASLYFRNYRKIYAIAQVSDIMALTGFKKIKQLLEHSPIETLQQFPFIGPITAFHLAKNLGLPFAKADRHLSRITKALGYNNVQELCDYISEKTGDTVQVVDIVLWRYATLVKNYANEFLRIKSSLMLNILGEAGTQRTQRKTPKVAEAPLTCPH